MSKQPSNLMTLVTTAVFFTAINVVTAQTIEDAVRLFRERKLDSTVVAAKNIISRDKSNIDAYILAGRALADKGSYADAVEYMEIVLAFPNAPAHAKAWAMRELSLCYFSKGDYAKAKESLQSCLALNATKNVTSAATYSSLLLGFDKFYDLWTTRESRHFIFHFQDTAALGNVAMFIQKKEAAFDKINSFLKASMPKKIDYFVWANESQAESLFKEKLAFTKSSLCLTHTSATHTTGHEMTHSISFQAAKVTYVSRLIFEGTGVCFDLSGQNNIAKLKGKTASISVTGVWKGTKKPGDDILYPLGGELVKRLIDNFGREKFMQLLADQSYDNAKKLYGMELDTLISKLEADLTQ